MKKLTPEKRTDILKEMMLADALFNEKRWAERYGVSISTVKRLRAFARDRGAELLTGGDPVQATVIYFTKRQRTG